MKDSNYYFGEPNNLYNNILDNMAHTEVHSCETSSIPLVDFWHPRNEKSISQLIDLLGLAIDLDKMQKCFEYPVFAEKNAKQIGRPSMTDLMLLDNQYRIAIEGKYTEKLYESIEKWKKNSKKNSNKHDVLTTWYDYIKRYSSYNQSDIHQIEHEVVYQFLHRTASACYKCDENGLQPVLVYQLFYNEWSDIIKVQCLNCRKSKENGNEKVRSKFQGRGFEALGRHRSQESMRTA